MTNMVSFWIVLIFTAFFAMHGVSAKVVYVSAAASDGGDGTSWPTACRYLQDALSLSTPGDSIWIAAGTYFPDDGINVVNGDRTASFTIKQNVSLYGGFSGGESSFGERNIETNLTFLSGEISVDSAEWSIHIVTLLGDSTLDGLRITKGNANSSTIPDNKGAGIYAPNVSSLVLTNCSISDNKASCSGGGMFFAAQTSLITSLNCNFSSNTAINNSSDSYSGGGAIYAYCPINATGCNFSTNTAANTNGSGGGGGSISSYSSSITLNNCVFTNNTSDVSGGAIKCHTTASSSLTASNCTFSGNTSYYYGGAINVNSTGLYGSSSTTLKDCIFTSNNAYYNGGAIHHVGSRATTTASNCTFTKNKANKPTNSFTGPSYGGGAIFADTLTLNNCNFDQNSVLATSNATSGPTSRGGAIYSDYLTANNCVFSKNSVSSSKINTLASGGAIYSATFYVVINNCKFIDNFAKATENANGGAIYTAYNVGSSIEAANCIFWGNKAYTTGTSSQPMSASGGAIYAEYSSINAVNCIFSENTTSSSSSNIRAYGGAIYSARRGITATNCIFSKNSVSAPSIAGGGAIYSIYQSSSSIIITNCTIINNSATGTNRKASAIFSQGKVKIFNNIFWGTLDASQNDFIYLASTASIQNYSSSLTSKNLLKEGLAAIAYENGAIIDLIDSSITIISSNPLFVNQANPIGIDNVWCTADDGFRLQTISPAVSEANSLILPSDNLDIDGDKNYAERMPIDLAGYPRIIATELDLGPYELSGKDYASWVEIHNLTGDNSLPYVNPANDGINNLMKYALYLDPNKVSMEQTNGVNCGMPRIDSLNSNIVYSYIKDTSKADVNYSILVSDDLYIWNVLMNGIDETPLIGNFVRVSATVSSEPEKFFRLMVTN